MDGFCRSIIIVFSLLCSQSLFAGDLSTETKTCLQAQIKVDYQTLEAVEYAPANAVVDKGNVSFKVNRYLGKSWLLVHDGIKIKSLADFSGLTTSIYEIVPCASKSDCFKQADNLHLTYEESDYDQEISSDSVSPVIIGPK